MKIEELIENEERKGFFSKVKNYFRPRNWLLAGALLYTTLAPLNCSKEDEPFIQPNRPPEITNLAPEITNVTYDPSSTIDENSLLKLIVDVTDPDGDTPEIAISGTEFSKISSNEFGWTPDYTQGDLGGKQYDFKITADDQKGGIDTELISVFVNDVPPIINRRPVLDFIPDITVDEMDLVTIIATGTDPDNDPLTFSYTPPLDAIGQWQTDYNDSGTYPTTVTADDGKGGLDSQLVNIIVNDVPFKIVFETIMPGPMIPGPPIPISPPRPPPVSPGPPMPPLPPLPGPSLPPPMIPGPPNPEIYKMDKDGSNQIRLTHNSAPVFDGEPAFSPTNGRKIAFTSDRNGNFEIYKMDKDGSNQIRLTNNPASDGNPAFSPDGTKIAFSSTRNGNQEIYIMNADGSNQINLTNTGTNTGITTIRESEPTWSPDGQKIAYQTNRDGNDEIYVINAAGSIQTRLTNNPARDGNPAFSPDGQKIAFVTNRDGNQEVYVMNADGSNQTRLTNNPAGDELPTWSPDGQKIAFATNRDGNFEIYKMNADGSNPIRLTNNPVDEKSPDWGIDK